MITMNAPNLPPRLPSSDAIEAAHALIALITDPAAAKANLDAILAAKASLDEATAANTAAAKEAQDAAAALAGVQAQAADLAAREAALASERTRLDVASGAIADRDEAVKLKEQASDRRAAEIEARAKALDDRLEAYRKALA